MSECAEYVLYADRSRPRRNRLTGADAVRARDGITVGHQRQRRVRSGGECATRKPVLRVARIGVAEGGLDAQRFTHFEIGLNIESFGNGITQVVGPLDLADRRDDVALDVFPLDVVDAARQANAVVDVVFRAELEALHGIRPVGVRRVRDAEIEEILGAAYVRVLKGRIEGDRRVAAAAAKTLGVGEVKHVIRVGLPLEARFGGHRRLAALLRARPRSAVLRSVRQALDGELDLGHAHAGDQLQGIRQLEVQFPEAGDLPVVAQQAVKIGIAHRQIRAAVRIETAAKDGCDGHSQQLIEKGVYHRIVDLLQTELAILGIERAYRPEQTSVWIIRLEPQLLGLVALLVSDARRRTVVLQSRRKMHPRTIEHRKSRGIKPPQRLEVPEVVQGTVVAADIVAVEIRRR